MIERQYECETGEKWRRVLDYLLGLAPVEREGGLFVEVDPGKIFFPKWEVEVSRVEGSRAFSFRGVAEAVEALIYDCRKRVGVVG